MELPGETEAHAQVRKGLTPEQVADERRIYGKISHIQAQLRQENLPAAKRTQRLNHLKQAERELEQFALDLKTHNPEYTRLQYPEPYRLEAVQKSLAEQEVLVEFFLGQEQSFVFAITRERLQMAALPKRAEIEKPVQTYRDFLRHSAKSAPGQDPEKILAEQQRRAYALYQQLLGPVRETLRRKTQVIVVPDGLLHYVPFETLIVTRPSDRPHAGTVRRGCRSKRNGWRLRIP